MLPRKCSLNSFFCSLAGIPIPVSLTSTLHESVLSDTKICTLPFSGVYFKAFEIMFFRIDSIFSLSNHTFIYLKLLSWVKLICLILAYCWKALYISVVNVFSSCSEIYSSEEYTSALSKFIRLVVRRSRAFTFRNAVFILDIPSLLSSSFSRRSSSGALISVNGVRMSCAVLIKK